MIIECKKVKFYAPYDEDAFFEYLKKIKSVRDIKGKKDVIYLTIKTLNKNDLHNLMGLFRRYNIKMNLLSAELNEPLKTLFNNNKKSYHINMYPAQ